MAFARNQTGLAGQIEPTPEINLSKSTSTSPGGTSPAYTGCGGVNHPVVNAAFEQRVVELVNEARAGYGLPPLKRIDSLVEGARYHAADMGQDDYFAHETYDRQEGDLVYVCSPWQRIATYYSGARGENAAAGYNTPEQAMQAWMNSAGHRANILSTASWEIGVGYYEGSGGYYQYWVQDFGMQSGAYPLIINREAANTDSREISIYIYGDWQEMRLRNGDSAWTDWQPFQSSFDWTLDNQAGEQTVYAELHRNTQTVTSSDSITLIGDGEPPELGNLPDRLAFIYSIPDRELLPDSQQVRPLNVGNNDVLTWEVTTEGAFFIVNPLNGHTPTPFVVRPTGFDTQTSQTYTGSLTIAVSDPASVAGSPHTINIMLQVVDREFYHIFLPGVMQ